MKKEMLVNALQPEESRIAIVENGVLEELYIERNSLENFVGNIYKGRVVNIEPSIQAAFVDFGVGRNGFLHVSDVEYQYYKHLTGPGGAAHATAPPGRAQPYQPPRPGVYSRGGENLPQRPPGNNWGARGGMGGWKSANGPSAATKRLGRPPVCRARLARLGTTPPGPTQEVGRPGADPFPSRKETRTHPFARE